MIRTSPHEPGKGLSFNGVGDTGNNTWVGSAAGFVETDVVTTKHGSEENVGISFCIAVA